MKNIQFKVLTITEENNELIQKLAKQKGINWRFGSDKNHIQKDALAILVGLGQPNKMEFLSLTNPIIEQMKLFMLYKLPEYSIDDIVKMLSELNDIDDNWNHHSDIIKNLNDSLSLYQRTIEDVEMYISKFIDFNFQIIHREYPSGNKWFIFETEENHYGIEFSEALRLIEVKKRITLDDIL